MVAVPEFDPAAAVSAQSSSKMLLAAQEHLGSLLAQVHTVLPALETCELAKRNVREQRDQFISASMARHRRSEHVEMVKKDGADAVAVAIGEIEVALGLSKSSLAALVAEAQQQTSKKK